MSHKLYCRTRRGIALLLCILMLSTVAAAAFAEEAHEHSFQLVGTLPPTCTEPGGTGYVCAVCGEPYWDNIQEPLGHDWEAIVFQQPTQETDGIMAYQCSRCGIYNQDYYEIIPATGTTELSAVESPTEEPDEPDLPESDPTVDLEAAPIWEAPFRGLMLTGDWRKDLVTIAWTQNGYEESEDNFEMVPKPGGGTTKNGYTRYGAWYGYPYGDWCAMFISFCLYYAGIPQDVFPYGHVVNGHVVEDWFYALADKGYCVAANAYTPKPGDLVFIKLDQSVDHVGIVCAVDEGADLLRTFEGNRTSKVETFDYSLKDPCIFAYAVLPDNPNPQPHPVLPDDETAAVEEQPAQTDEEAGETGEPAEPEAADTVLTGESDAGSFKVDEPVPEGTELMAVSVPTSDAVTAVIQNAVAEEMQADPEEIFVTAYQVALKQPNGTASSKSADVTLKTAFPLPVISGRTAQVRKTVAVYSSENGTLTTLDAQAKTENGVITSVSFHAPEAATYAICVALSFTEAEPESPTETTSGEATGGSEQQSQDQQVAEENAIPAGTVVQCDAGSFKADEAVPEGTQLMAVSVSTSDAVAAAIQNAVAEEMQADPEEIFVTAYQVALVQPNGAVSSKGADVTLKTEFPLPAIPGRTAQVKKTLVAYSADDGAFKTLSAQAKTESGVITSVSFHAPEAGIYTICVALGFTEAEPENPTTSEGEANESGQQTQDQQITAENSIPAGTLVQCDAGSFKADKAVPEGTQLLAKESTPNNVVIWTIQNFIQKYIAASEPEEITVTAYQVMLASPDGSICPSAAEVTLKTALPLPTVETAGTVRNTQVKDIVTVYASEDGVLHVYKANPQTQGNVITSVSFYAPVSSVYAICYTLKIAE